MDVEKVNERANHYLGEARGKGVLSTYDKFYFAVADTGLVLSDKMARYVFETAEALLCEKKPKDYKAEEQLRLLKGRIHELVTGELGRDDFSSDKQMGIYFETGEFTREEA